MPRSPVHHSIAIIGAGPYGLAIAARLKRANRDFVILGRPMGFWRAHVPLGTRLLSTRASSSLSEGAFDYHSYTADTETYPPIFGGDDLVAYGLWFQRKACGEVDEREVVQLTRENGAFQARLDDRSEIAADRVIVATGLLPFAYVPLELAPLRGQYVFHTSDLRDLSGFAGKQVAVIGSGQSAIDCAALLLDQNAEAEVLARAKEIRWQGSPIAPADERLTRRKWTLRRAARDFLYKPEMFWNLPAFARAKILARVLVPAADRTLMPRVSQLRITLGRTVLRATAADGKVALHLDDARTRTVDRVVVGTGYRIDPRALPFLSSELSAQIRTAAGYPLLNRKMESSVSGLYFAGAPCAWNFGPYMWFIRGAVMAARILSRNL